MDQLLERLQRGKDDSADQVERLEVPVLRAHPASGLTTEQVRERMEAGWANLPVESAGKTTKQIILSNVFTYFNILFFFLALCVCAVGFLDPYQFARAGFIGVVIINSIIGIV